MIKVDTHLHSRGSSKVIVGNCVTSRLGVLESYISAEEQYRIAKRRGMDLVTLSDHDTISEAKKLVELHPDDTFISCEYWVKGRPEGQDFEVVTLDVSDNLHKELMAAKGYGIKPFMEILKAANSPFFLAHPACSIKSQASGVKVPEIEEWIEHCDVIEGINGNCQRENEIAHIIAKYRNLAMCGGSDDHAGLTTALAYTVAPQANSKEDFLQHFKEGKIRPEGEYSSVRKSQEEMLKIGRQFIADERRKQKERGFFRYFNEDPVRILVALAPLVFPFYLRVAGRRLKDVYEKNALALEREYLKFIQSEHCLRLKEAVSDLEAKLEIEFDEMVRIVKPRNEYITRLNIFERILDFFIGKSDSIKSGFE